MRRVLAFVLSLTLPVGLLGWTHHAMTQAQDDVKILPLMTIGDPAAMDGHELLLESWCGENMRWQTEFSADGQALTRFDFIPEREAEVGEESAMFELYLSGGVGMSTSGSFELSDSGLANAVRAVADQTQPGEEKTMTLLLEDYADYYELSYEVNIHRGQTRIWHHNGWPMLREDSENSDQMCHREWMERFRFPVVPGQKIEIVVGKNMAGGISQIHYNMVEDAPRIGFSAYAAQDGLYFSPGFMTWDGEPLTTGQFPQGYGIYYIPYLQTKAGGSFDFEKLELLYALEPADQVITMQADAERGLLHLLVEQDSRFVYARMNMETKKIEASLDVGTEYSHNFQFFLDEGLYLLNGQDTITLVDISGQPEVLFTAALPEGAEEHQYDDLIYENGRLYLAGKIYDQGEILVVCACGPEGVSFYGRYAWDQWQGYGYVYGMKPELIQVAFS